jgi:hypothetical protein
VFPAYKRVVEDGYVATVGSADMNFTVVRKGDCLFACVILEY